MVLIEKNALIFFFLPQEERDHNMGKMFGWIDSPVLIFRDP